MLCQVPGLFAPVCQSKSFEFRLLCSSWPPSISPVLSCQLDYCLGHMYNSFLLSLTVLVIGLCLIAVFYFILFIVLCLLFPWSSSLVVIGLI